MGRFNVCIRKVLRAQGERPSHAFIQFHWCVESQSRLTGESFSDLFQRLGQQFRFGREPENWPNAEQLRAAGRELLRERKLYLGEMGALIEKRRQQKLQGYRQPHNETLDQREEFRRIHNLKAPRMGCWGWKLARAKVSSTPL